jgi:hypothetical protein
MGEINSLVSAFQAVNGMITKIHDFLAQRG